MNESFPIPWLLLAVGMSIAGFGPGLGSGFARDDFRWLWHTRLEELADLARMLTDPMGFFRPATALWWGFEQALAGPDPLLFSASNLAVHLVVIGLLMGLTRRWSDDPLAAGLAGILAAASVHYTPQAVTWISGRGCLLAAAAGCGALLLWDRWLLRRRWLDYVAACALLLLACLAYEGAAALPLLLVVLTRLRPSPPPVPALAALGGPLVTFGVYFGVRTWVGAMQPWAPTSGYAYRLEAVLPNLAEYLARAAVPGTVLIAILVLVAGLGDAARAVASATVQGARACLAPGIAWFLAGLLPTLPVPRRSDLYVYFAALGIHLVAGCALASGFRRLRRETGGGASLSAAALLLLLVCVWPVYAWDRVRRPAREADLATRAVDELRHHLDAAGDPQCLVLEDVEIDEDDRINLRAAFSDHLPWVVALATDGPPSHRAWYADALPDGALRNCSGVARFRLRGESLRTRGPVLELRRGEDRGP